MGLDASPGVGPGGGPEGRPIQRLSWSFEARLVRANALAGAPGPHVPLLRFYEAVTRCQAAMDRLDGSLAQAADAHLGSLRAVVAAAGPPALREAATRFHATPGDWAAWWETRDADPVAGFFFKGIAQPWAERRVGASPAGGGQRCPWCHGPPLVGLLRSSSEGAPLFLQCAICSGCWPYPRIACSACPERDPKALAVHTAAGAPGIRVSTCATCRSYLKVVDLGVDGRAVPVVDELAAVALDVWARDQGYAKVEPNLAGL